MSLSLLPRTALTLLLVFGATGSAQAQSDSLETLLGTVFGCELVEQLLADMPVEPLYRTNSSGTCEAIDARNGNNGDYFTDDSCNTQVTYQVTEMLNYCQGVIDKENLGNGLEIVGQSWTHTPGSRLDLGARSLVSLNHPYLQRLVYRTVGECNLEMRIYKSHPGATNLKPLIALHGGSWAARGFGFFGLELTVPHYTNEGFVVYAPFYRLLDSKESIPACHNSDITAITSDAEAALDWVIRNQSAYGSSGKPVVFGQSAGGHLATSLAVNRADDISGAVLMYPPTDFSDFVERANGGYYTNPEGIKIVDDVIGGPVSSADITASPIPENSFPQRVFLDPARFPPMMLIHGISDELVEARQSARLCDALAARPLLPVGQELTTPDELRTITHCGTAANGLGSTMHLILQGKHALDVCINDSLPNGGACPAGNADSRQLVADTIAQAVSFSVFVAANSVPESNPSSGGSGGGGAEHPIWLLIFFGLRRYRALSRMALD